jgi:hypothetical protein
MSTPDNQALRNRMRVRFLKPEFCTTAWRLIIGEEPITFAKAQFLGDMTPLVRRWLDNPRVYAEYEVDGWDVLLTIPDAVRDALSPALHDVCLQLEPVVGDDFPTILRAMKAKSEPTFGQYRALIIDRFEAKGASLDDVRKMFEPYDVSVLTGPKIIIAARAKSKEPV